MPLKTLTIQVPEEHAEYVEKLFRNMATRLEDGNGGGAEIPATHQPAENEDLPRMLWAAVQCIYPVETTSADEVLAAAKRVVDRYRTPEAMRRATSSRRGEHFIKIAGKSYPKKPLTLLTLKELGWLEDPRLRAHFPRIKAMKAVALNTAECTEWAAKYGLDHGPLKLR